jgi:mannose-6-phosphate isomerase-like protein (cupin superfamily)
MRSARVERTGSAPTETAFGFAPTGERFVLTSAAADTSRLRFDFYVAPGGGVRDTHCHLRQWEDFRCISGTLDVTVEGEVRKLQPGDEVSLPPGTLHSLVNSGDTEVHCEVDYRPAGRNRDWFLLIAAFIHRTGREPKLLDLAPFLPDVDLYLKGPIRVQQLALRYVLKPLGIALGRRRRMLAYASDAYGRPFDWNAAAPGGPSVT